MRRLSRALATLAILTGCGAQAPRTALAPQGGQSGAWVLVTVQSAQISPSVANDEWDEPGQPDRSEAELQSLGTLLGLVNPLLGSVVKASAGLVHAPAPDSKLTYPDPMVRVTFNEAVSQREIHSRVAVDAIRPAWDYAFYARIDTLRDAGIDIEVADDDGKAMPARIGAVNLPRPMLANVVKTGRTADLEYADGELQSLKVRIEPVVVGASSESRQVTLALADGVTSSDLVIPEGAIVSVRVTGAGRIGGGGIFGCSPDVTPVGLSGSECQDYNLPGYRELAGAPHGSAVALLGTPPTLQAVALTAHGGAAGCLQFVAPVGGPLWFAINDCDPQNNSGSFRFEVQVHAPQEPGADMPTACATPGEPQLPAPTLAANGAPAGR